MTLSTGLSTAQGRYLVLSVAFGTHITCGDRATGSAEGIPQFTEIRLVILPSTGVMNWFSKTTGTPPGIIRVSSPHSAFRPWRSDNETCRGSTFRLAAVRDACRTLDDPPGNA
jgi:hypothetical protein